MLIQDKKRNRGVENQCDTVNLLWKAHDAQGAPIVNQVDYRLGKLSRYVGVPPDPASPGGVKPAWGVAEILDLAAQAKLPDDEPSDPFYLTTNVHPEPGRPEHILCLDDHDQLCGDIQRYWPRYGTYTTQYGGHASEDELNDAYFVGDRYWNRVFGLTEASASQPAGHFVNGLPVDPPEVEFDSQLEGSGEPSLYSLKTSARASSNWPQGDYLTTLSVAYPQDPDSEWGPGTVSKDVLLRYDSEYSSHLLVPMQSYDQRNGTADGTADGEMPMTVAPGAETGGLPKTAAGNTPCLVLLALEASDVHIDILNGHEEPTRQLGHAYWKISGQWQYDNTGRPMKLETADGPQFAMRLIDRQGNAIPQTKFRVHRCPQYNHFTDPQDPDPGACTIAAVDSDDDGVLASVQLNPDGGGPDSRGYLGIELVKAPVSPGDYYIEVRQLNPGSNGYRLRHQGDMIIDNITPEGESVGGFLICTVHGVKLLNEDLAPITKTLNMSLNRAVYLQEIDPDKDGDSYQSDVVLHNEDTQEDFTLSNVTFWRVGKTPSFLTGLITVVSPDPPLAPPAAAWDEGITMQLDARVQNTSPAGTLAPTSGRYRAFRGSGTSRLAVAPGGTRLVEIVTATSNFDGVRVGRQWVNATVKWLADGHVAVAMQNVDNPAVYTFEYWQGTPLTTDLRQGSGLRVKGLSDPGDGVQFSVAGQTAVFPPGGIGFKPLVPPLPGEPESTIRTVNPGLYRLRARWGRNAGLALETDYDPWCWTDKPELGICENDWIVSVGERIWLHVEPAARTGLQNDLQTKLGITETAEDFLDAVVAEVNAKYSEASANVVVSLTDAMPKPYMRHAVRDQLDPDPRLPDVPNYAMTSLEAKFPLLNPGEDLAEGSDRTRGISSTQLFEGRFLDGLAVAGTWVAHDPRQARNLPPNPCNLPPDTLLPDLDTNPCPREVLLNRWVNVVAHETAHGFGVLALNSYPLHSLVLGWQTSLVAVQATWNGRADNEGYNEQDTNQDQFHEPILGSHQVEARNWVMTYGIYRWNGIGRTPAFSDPDGNKWSYDQTPSNGRPVNWLVFDRPLRFSLSLDFPSGLADPRADRSIQRFFKERLPVCDETRYCR